MNTVFHITRVFIFLVLASFASTALSITINSELGTASLDGAWGFACEVPDLGDPDEIEVLEFAGNTVKAYVIEYASMDGSCTGSGTIIPEVEGTVVANDFEFDVTWIDDDDNLNNPPDDIPPVPVPAAFWLFGTALIGFVGMSRRTKVS